MNKSLKTFLPHIIAIVLFCVLSCICFIPQLQGKKVAQSDIVSHRGMSQEISKYRTETGRQPLWTNAMFGGMPAFLISLPHKSNLVYYVDLLYHLGSRQPVGMFFGLMLGFYILLISLGTNPWLSMVGAIAFGFSTNHFVLYEAGHNTKVIALMYFGLVSAGVILAMRKKYLLGTALFTLGMALNIMSGHYQMTFYLAMILTIYVLFELARCIKDGEIASYGKVAVMLSLGLLLAVGTNTAKLWTTYEYSRESMRGKPILASEDKKTNSSATEGLSWDYAMQWSNGWIDLPMMLVPGFVGGGSGELVGKGSEMYSIMKRSGAKAVEGKYQAPLYWGKLPFTSGPVYFGAGICLLFFMGLFLVKGPLKWWLLAATLLTVLLSLGKNLAWFQHLFFDYVPMYNKFRSPNSILGVTTFVVPLLGILGLSQILNNKVSKQAATRALLVSGGITGGICLLIALVGPGLFDSSLSVNNVPKSYEPVIKQVFSDRKSLMRSDAFRSLAIIVLFGGLIFLYIKEKLKPWMLCLGLGIITTADLWTVGKRYLHNSKFVSERSYQKNFAERPADKQILKTEKSRGDYRVLDMSVNVFNSSIPAYHHNLIGGYHPAKLQRYQDVIDNHIGKSNQAVLDMLNTKYIIAQSGQVQQNPNASGTAWFVDNIKKVSSPKEEIDGLTGINPTNDAIVLDQEFNNYIGDFDPQKNGTIKLTKYDMDRLTYDVNTSSEQLAVFSEMWYGPDKGWNAYIDGKAVDHIRANYILRALRIPAGEHKVEFKFESVSLKTGSMISLICSILVILGVLGALGLTMKGNKNGELLAKNETD